MKSEEPLLVDTGRGVTLKYRGCSFYSSVDPVGGALRRVERVDPKEHTLYFVPSVGLGYGLAELASQLPSTSHLLCVEADQVLMAAAEQFCGLPRISRLTIVRTDDPAQVVGLLRTLGTESFRRIETVKLSGGYRVFRSLYDDMAGRLEEEIRFHWFNRMTLIHMGRLWIKNLLINLPVFVRAGDVRHLSTTLPILVTGAGPSLESCIPWIKGHRNRFVLLSTDTSLPVMGDSGIKPDVIIALESQLANLQDFITHPFTDVPLLCDITSSPNVVRLFRDKCFFFSSSFHPLLLTDRLAGAGLLPTSFPPLGSVGVAALHAALHLTMGPVILAGMDFSYIGNRTHSRGTLFDSQSLREADRLRPHGHNDYEAVLGRPLIQGKGKGGKEVLTDLVLRNYADQTAHLIARDKRVFDISSEGLVTGAAVLNTQADFAALLNDSGECRPEDRLVFSSSPVEERSEAMRVFAEHERDKLQNVLEMIKGHLKEIAVRSTGMNSGIPIDLSSGDRKLLEEMDYLYFFFPETEKDDLTRPGCLSRIYSAGLGFRPHWKRLSKR